MISPAFAPGGVRTGGSPASAAVGCLGAGCAFASHYSHISAEAMAAAFRALAE